MGSLPRRLLWRARCLFDRKKASQPGLFVHIPKTSGMSFVDALAQRQSVVYAYGRSAPRTSDSVQENIYDHYRPDKLFRTTHGDPVWLAGHFRVFKHAELVECRRIITFVRDPVDRVISHFNHAISYISSDGIDIDSFINQPINQNVQSKYLDGMPRDCIGFVGVTEHNDASLAIINHELGLDLSQQYTNRNTTKTLDRERLDEGLYRRIRELNWRDLELYDWAVANLETRYRFISEGKPWCHGVYTVTQDAELCGIAFYAASDEAVTVNILRNGVHLKTLTADLRYRQPLPAIFPRRQRIAFRLPVQQPYSDYDVVVASTGQRLNFSAAIA